MNAESIQTKPNEKRFWCHRASKLTDKSEPANGLGVCRAQDRQKTRLKAHKSEAFSEIGHFSTK